MPIKIADGVFKADSDIGFIGRAIKEASIALDDEAPGELNPSQVLMEQHRAAINQIYLTSDGMQGIMTELASMLTPAPELPAGIHISTGYESPSDLYDDDFAVNLDDTGLITEDLATENIERCYIDVRIGDYCTDGRSYIDNGMISQV